MNTTVKGFIINNLSDEHFERLVYRLIIEEFCKYEPNLSDQGTAYYLQNRCYTEKNTYTILQAIQNLQKEDLDSLYHSIVKMPIAFLEGEPALEIDLEAHEVTESNYQLFIDQELLNKTADLIRFIYEVSESRPGEPLAVRSELYNEWLKFEGHTGTPSRSYVEISNRAGYSFGYCVCMLLDSRTRYVSAEAQSSYRSRWDADVPVSAIKFAEFDEIAEDLEMDNEYRLEPFTHYLNEPITVPPVSDEVIYDLVEQLIILLTAQGFTEQEQQESVHHYDQQFDVRYK